MTDAEAAAALHARLEPGETLLWSQAAPANELASEAIGFAIFATLWAGFAVYAASRMLVHWSRARADRLPAEHGLGGAIAGGVMCLFAIALFIAAWNQYAGAWWTNYGLTDRRVIVAREFPIPNATSYGRAAFEKVEVDGRAIHFDYGDAGKGGDNFRETLRNIEAPVELVARIRAALAEETNATDPPP